jgi:hypothetical protein
MASVEKNKKIKEMPVGPKRVVGVTQTIQKLAKGQSMHPAAN